MHPCTIFLYRIVGTDNTNPFCFYPSCTRLRGRSPLSCPYTPSQARASSIPAQKQNQSGTREQPSSPKAKTVNVIEVIDCFCTRKSPLAYAFFAPPVRCVCLVPCRAVLFMCCAVFFCVCAGFFVVLCCAVLRCAALSPELLRWAVTCVVVPALCFGGVRCSAYTVLFTICDAVFFVLCFCAVPLMRCVMLSGVLRCAVLRCGVLPAKGADARGFLFARGGCVLRVDGEDRRLRRPLSLLDVLPGIAGEHTTNGKQTHAPREVETKKRNGAW